MSGFTMRKLEIYYRASYTYVLYVVIIRVLLVILIMFKPIYTLIYFGDFAAAFFIQLPVIDRYIQERKDQENEDAENEELLLARENGRTSLGPGITEAITPGRTFNIGDKSRLKNYDGVTLGAATSVNKSRDLGE